MKRFLHYAAAAAGLIAIVWVGVGYVGANPLALAVTALIGAFYVMGLLELHRFEQATVSLSQALAALSEPPASLGAWLERLPASLRNAVRLRIEGERVGLPGPAMTPYLAGLLVLLGMLGTFLGMVVTLNGTGTALAGATDLEAIRASLSAPVKGLGLAFGTSVAGVAASAMLGLVSALCRRERLQAGQLLDAHAATTLRPHSLAQRREESFKLLQQQAHGMPELVDRLQAMMVAMERRSEALDAQLLASQDRFHDHAEAVYTGLASSVDRTLRQSLLDSAHAASAAIQPVVEATMAGIARETASLHEDISRTVHLQLDGLSGRFEATTSGVAGAWQTALAAHQRTAEAMSREVGAAHAQLAESFAQRSATLVDGVSVRLETAVDRVSDTWRDALAQHVRTGDALSSDMRQTLAGAATAFEQQATSLLATVDRAHVALQADMQSRDEQRLAAWTTSLTSTAAALEQQWQHTGAQAAQAQRELIDALAQTARDMSATTEAHARNTIAEIAQLLQAAAEAPRAAAEVVAELRQKLSDSMARDNAMLEERSRILETLSTLLDAVNHASTEQRTAVDALVTASADVLERVGSRFTDTIEAETGKLATVAAQVTGSAVEVASLGEAFGVAVQLFSDSNEKLVGHLQRIEGALGKSLARSDEQLAYYVAQAREVIDLSIMSQKQVVEDLQQIASRQALAGSDA